MRSIRSLALIATVIAACATADVVRPGRRERPRHGPRIGLDAVRHVGITGGQIAVVSEKPLTGKRVIDAANHVVAPGFIDLHEHGQQEDSYRMMVRDGVTTALELEVGVPDVAKFYGDRAAGQIVNYGAAVGHIGARMKVLGDPSTTILPAGIGGTGSATEAQVAEMEAMLRKGLAEGAVAVGLGSAYTPGATMDEIQRMFKVAARATRRRTFTSGTGWRGSTRRSPRRRPRAPSCTSSMPTRWAVTRWPRSSRRSRWPVMRVRT
jgi:cytosine/adenosine deaminase-related metal-dependent hydrolase